MKKIFYFFILTLTIISCNADDDKQITNSDLVGKWKWTNTDGGYNFNIHETPETAGKTIHLTLMKNYSFSIIENGTPIANGTYKLSNEESIYTREMERFIEFSDMNQEPVFATQGIITIDKNELYISDNNYDGIGSKFVKIE